MTRRSVAAEALKKRAGRGRGRMTLMQQIHAAREARRPAHRGGAKSSSASSSSGEGAYTPGSTFLSTPQALAAATIRCGTGELLRLLPERDCDFELTWSISASHRL